LGRKLQEPAPPKSPGARGRGAGAPAHDDAKQTVDDLVLQVRELCQERRGIRRDIEAVDERYGSIIRDLKLQLEAVQIEHSEMRCEHARLRNQLADVDAEHMRECERLAQRKEESGRRLQSESEKLESACRLVAGHLATLQGELQEYQKRTDQLGRDHVAAEEEQTRAIDAQSTTREELELVRRRVHQSEEEVKELQEKYSLVGERFERVMDVSEKENRVAAKDLQSKTKRNRHKAERQKRKIDEAKDRLSVLQAEVTRQEVLLSERDSTIKRLQETYQTERENAMRREEHFYESQRRSLKDQASELQKFGAMMPLAVHQKILHEQGEWFAATVSELEDALRQQIKQQETFKHRQLHWEREHERLNYELDHTQVEMVQSGALRRTWKMEEELSDLQAKLLEAESSAAAIERQRSALAGQLEASSAKLSFLRDTLEEERSSKSRAQASLAEARRRLSSIKAATTPDSQLSSQEELRANYRRLEDSHNSQKRQIVSLEQGIVEIRQKESTVVAELGKVRKEKHDMEARLHALHEEVLRLDKQHVLNARAICEKQAAISRLRSLLKGHAGRSHREAAQLRVKLQEEQQLFLGEFKGRAQQWTWAVGQHKMRVANNQDAGRRTAEDGLKAGDALLNRLQNLKSAAGGLRSKIERATEAVDVQRRETERVSSAVQVSAANMERLVRCAGSALSGKLSEGTIRGLLVPGKLAPEALASLEAELLRVLDASKAGAVGADLAREVKELEAERLRLAEDEPAVAKISEEVSVRKSKAASLSEEYARIQQEVRVSSERVQAAEAELEDQQVMAGLAVDEAKQRASRPIQAEIQEAMTEVQALQKRLQTDIGQQEAAWKEHLDLIENDASIERRKVEADFRQDVSRLRRELDQLGEARAKTIEARESSVTMLQTELSSILSGIDEFSGELHKLEGLNGSCKRGARRHREVMRQVERRVADVSQARQRTAANAEDKERELSRQHEETMTRLRRQYDAEAARLENIMKESLSSVSLLAADGDSALRAHSELQATSERLREQFRSHIEHGQVQAKVAHSGGLARTRLAGFA